MLEKNLALRKLKQKFLMAALTLGGLTLFHADANAVLFKCHGTFNAMLIYGPTSISCKTHGENFDFRFEQFGPGAGVNLASVYGIFCPKLKWQDLEEQMYHDGFQDDRWVDKGTWGALIGLHLLIGADVGVFKFPGRKKDGKCMLLGVGAGFDWRAAAGPTFVSDE